MNEALYIDKGGTRLRCGYTTGSCAAAASKAALLMLLTGEDYNNVSIITPAGPVYTAEIVDTVRDDDVVSCSVIKDGGDDPDITTGAHVRAEVRLSDEKGVVIKGGIGVGIVTKPGLDQPVGEHAINSVPRRMIAESLNEVLSDKKVKDKGVVVTISVPEGEELAGRTFNPKLGIVGGISILGTTGIVEPMSDKALISTIRTEINMRKEEGSKTLLVAPGNYGMTFLSKTYGIDKDKAVMCSNFVYDTVQTAVSMGFKRLLFVGHMGKLIKVAGGIKNTHSMYGDHRMEILSDIAGSFISGPQKESLTEKILACVATDEAVRIITEAGIADKVLPEIAGRIKKTMEDWTMGKLEVETIVFAGEYSELVSTDMAHEYIKRDI